MKILHQTAPKLHQIAPKLHQFAPGHIKQNLSVNIVINFLQENLQWIAI